MAIDGLTLHALTSELNDRLPGGQVQKIYQPEDSTLTFDIWTGQERTLLVSTGMDFRVHITESNFENPDKPPPFCMLLRKHLQGGHIRNITQRGFDRLLTIEIEREDDSSPKNSDRSSIKQLKIELMGRNSNLLLVKEGEIMDCMYRKETPNRKLEPHQPYQPPEQQEKINPLEMTYERTENIFKEPDPGQEWKSALHNIEGFGPTLSRELLARADIESSGSKLTESELGRIWTSIQKLQTTLKSEDFTPTVYLEGREPVEFAPFELEVMEGKNSKKFDTLSRAIDFFYRRKHEIDHHRELRQELEQALAEEKDRVEGAKKNVNQQLDRAENSKRYKRIGDIILANLNNIEQGTSQVDLPDPYNEGDTITVKLNPSKSPQENAQEYYEKYKKLKRGKPKLTSRLKQLKKEEQLVNKLGEQLQKASKTEELEEIQRRMSEEGILEEESKGTKQSRGGPRIYDIEGYQVKVGKSARQNDKLIREAARHHIWLHVRNYAGSHVIIVTHGRPEQVPNSVIEKAAQLAGYYSKARNSEQVQVSYTLVKYVDKPKGAKPGLVRISNEKTITAKPAEVVS